MPHWIRPIITGYSEAAIKLRLAGDPDQMVLTQAFHFPALPTVADANAVMAAFVTRMAPRLSTLLTIEGVHILTQESSTLQRVVDSTSASAAGTRASSTSVLPPNNAYLVRKRTSFAGRAHRGRWYVPGVIEADADNVGAIAGADVTLWQTALNALYADWTTYRPCLNHSALCTVGDRGHVGAHNAVPPMPSDLSSYEMDDRIATQRRRLNR